MRSRASLGHQALPDVMRPVLQLVGIAVQSWAFTVFSHCSVAGIQEVCEREVMFCVHQWSRAGSWGWHLCSASALGACSGCLSSISQVI